MSSTALETAVLYEEARTRRAEGNVTGAFARYRRLLELAEAAADPVWRGALMAEIGAMYQDAFDLLEARRWLEKALPLQAGVAAAEALLRLGQIERLSGAPEAAEQRFDAALSLAPEPLASRVRLARALLLWEQKRAAEGAGEAAVAYGALKHSDPPEAQRAALQIREMRGRVGTLAYRALLSAAGADPDLLE